MQEHHFLTQALVYLAAASLFVPLFKRIGLGSVLGYLVAGVAIGSWGLGLITDQDAVREVSELGVVLLLFLVGLELNPERLWSLRRAIFGLGSLQVLVTIGLVSLALMPMGLHWSAAVAFGMAAAMSSTAIALQILAERNVLKAAPGQSVFAVSLFQDLAVIPILLGLSLLGPADGRAQQA
jgi:Kef-type K+ transport system membrane component KefB